MSRPKFHYGWIILFISFFAVAGSLGIGRFSYGMLLPSLQGGIGLNYNEAGFIASANMLGYCLATLAVGSLVFRFGSRTAISLSLFAVSLSMMAVGFSGSFVSVSLFRFITGASSAGANITVMGLSSHWFSQHRRGIANGFLVGGSGLAMLLTGWLVPKVIEIYPEQGWRYNWFILGGVVLVISVLSWILIRNIPQGQGLTPLGSKNFLSSERDVDDRIYTIREIISLKSIHFIAATYFCFGMSYIIYTTFFVNYLIGEKGLTQAMAGDIWSIVGLLSIGSAILWGSLSDAIGRPAALTFVFLLQGISYIISAITTGTLFMGLSAIIFGLTAWSIPGIMASYCGDLLGPRNTTASLGFVTLFFSMGCIFGPTIAGYIKEISGSFTAAFYLAAGIALLGGILSLSQIYDKRMGPVVSSNNTAFSRMPRQ